MSDFKTTLNESEKATRLSYCEQTIALGKTTFIDVGNALAEIMEQQLFKLKGFDSFADYAESAWGFKKSYAYQLISHAEIAKSFSDSTIVENLKPSQSRELAKVDPAQREEVLRQAGTSPTAKSIREAAEKVAPKPATKDAEFLAAVGLPSAPEIETELEQIQKQLRVIEQHIQDADMVAEDYRLLAREIFHLSERVARIGKSKSAMEVAA